ncbi:EF-P lysine aminoacylase EpmA [Idiomarina sp.]|uniref:EF-P lysine aminoacylase EpmA n=2 Tax=unclassified Idiomarina TaxID=2614829 RepID=UPI000C8CE099|nr:elongation factor P lysine(34) lysyltransferase [Idiomarinaceae bacterium]MEC7643503.1 EF-P lysine aminoacylase EpmA [Pseudomonadota bacterium]|tara:strand:+ start:2906 stop:3865 length:960 start_codon:yes stop_codon:yes gene_type:complete
MSDWRSKATLNVLKRRAELLRQLRSFFFERDVLEVDTPLLCQHGVTDRHIENLSTRDSQNNLRYLQTSPEYAMKRLLAQYRHSIYQLSHVVRDDPVGRHHNPEFMMLEWYRVGLDDDQLIAEIDELLTSVADAPPLVKLTYQDAFLQHMRCDPLTSDGIQAIHQRLKEDERTQQWMADEDDENTILQVAFNFYIEPRLSYSQPTAITHFPASQAALAQIDSKDPRVARRFEIYWQGVELANGYFELTNAAEQSLRFELDIKAREIARLPYRRADNLLLAALEHGIPQCAGVAMGVDRLLMIVVNADAIDQVLPFSYQSA